ncbi:LANO_0C07558g1_1 [Lachancea nothofagi CBS 11611]|uniref:LANO_0C07558g1_1 n=1 Tax=Lachancea nothofagi CBS 11611 TaxID=1266666 RepID=A0A1G4J967_9SACH|nr:LANO_0C07558g1_1 [Lachancea nothofagi CBS 11611]
MSVPLKPLSIDFNNRQLDSKQKKFHSSIERALQHFDSVTEWADYIASLGKLLKALQSWTPQFQNVKYYVPYPYQVSRRLASSLSPNLPSGVHLKTIEVYNIIFAKIGIEALNKECNIWVPGILPLMSYASISVKAPLIELYENYLIQLSPSALRLLIKPLLASLFPDVDDESSESQPATLILIETLRENVADEPLFWQSCFMVMINNKERRLGGLAWLTKTLPSLNAVPHKVQRSKTEEASEGQAASDTKNKRQSTLKLLLPAAKDVVHPEPGLLIRCLVSCLQEENELLIKRGILDLLLQRINLDSPVLQDLTSPSDFNLLMMSCCNTMLSRDMSISRRIWNWLLGPASTTGNSLQEANANDYFPRFGEAGLEAGLAAMINDEEKVPEAFKICLAIMDRWEIASHIIPKVFVPLMQAAFKFQENQIVMKNASAFFDSVETNVICSHLFRATIEKHDLDLLVFVLSRFKIGHDEEIVVRHLPLILLAILCRHTDFAVTKFHIVCELLLELIPERAYLPIKHSGLANSFEHKQKDDISAISDYYTSFLNGNAHNVNEVCDVSPPFSTEDLTFMIVLRMHDCLLFYSDEASQLNQMVDLFVFFFDRVPQGDSIGDSQGDIDDKNCHVGLSRPIVNKLFEAKKSLESGTDSIFGWVKLYSNYLASDLTVIEAAKLTKVLVAGLWIYLINPDTQIEAVKCLDALETSVGGRYVESSLSFAFLEDKDIDTRISALDALWTHSENTGTLARRPLELVLEELFDNQDPNYLSTSRWVTGVIKHGFANRLYHVLCENLLNQKLIEKSELEDLDDIDSFVYYCQILINVLKVEHPIVLKSFETEQTSVQPLELWKGEDVTNYKNLAIAIATKFLKIKNTTGKSVRTVLLLLGILLDGTEQNFQLIVTFLLELTTQHFNTGTQESELISVSLLNIISRVLALSHDKQLTLGIFEDDNSHLRYIDFLVTGVMSMQKPLIIHSYVKLLSESLVYFQNSIFSIILPLTTSITECIKNLFRGHSEKGHTYQSIAYLINGLQELMEVSHSYLSAEESGGYLGSAPSRNEFLQNMVANVFSNDSGSVDSKLRHEREIVVQSFKLVVNCCLEIWTWAQNYSKSKEIETLGGEVSLFGGSLHHQAYKYKSQSKKLLSAVFALEPLEVLEELISEHPDNVSLTLIHALDGNKPALTLPHLFQGIVYRCNKFSTVTFSNTVSSKSAPSPLLINQLNAKVLLKFILEYLTGLENAAIEDFYYDFMCFIKETLNYYQHYKKLSSLLLMAQAIVCEKVNNSRFGEEKTVKRELSDLFCKFLQTALAEDANSSEDAALNDLNAVCSKLKFIVMDYPAGDKFTSCISTIVQSAISPSFKKQSEQPIPERVLKLVLTVSHMASKVKSFKTLISDEFGNDKKFALFEECPLWSQIVFEWSNYSENKEKLMYELLVSTSAKANAISPNINPFTAWSDSEVQLRCHNILRICYLLLISPQDHYILNFKIIMTQLEQSLISEDLKIRSCSFLLLRCVLLQFSAMHFIEYWSMLSYSLQTGLQNFFECLQMQQNTDPNVILQVAKCVDLILTLNFEEFSASYEWLFVIDTMNCIYKTDPYISLADEISDCKDFIKSDVNEFEVTEHSQFRAPLLQGVHAIVKHTQLRKFFHNVSYAHYEEMYSLKTVDWSACRKDVLADIFAFIRA